LVRNFVIPIQQHRERMAILFDVFAHLGFVFQFIDGQDHESLVPESIIGGLHGRHFRRAGFTPRGPKVHEYDFPTILP